MTHEEALELAQEVLSGKARSYVSAAITLSKHLLEASQPAKSTLLPAPVIAKKPSIPPTPYQGPLTGPTRGDLEARRDTPTPLPKTPPSEYAAPGSSPTPKGSSPDSPCALEEALGPKRSFTPLSGTPRTRPHDEDLDEHGPQPLPTLADLAPDDSEEPEEC